MAETREATVKRLFLEAAEVPSAERSAFLRGQADEQICAEVEELLRHEEAAADDFLAGALPGATPLAGSLPLERVGQYRIERLIASGGMGSVYEAVQEQPRRNVALKVMKPGIASPAMLRRFEYESQILAGLRHPGIAQVYEAGAHLEGDTTVPFFVMEFIPDAQPITEFAIRHELSVRERLQLFLQACAAVHHGHQKGIIHRDLKPGNILVDAQEQVKIIDFGVARATNSDIALTTMQTDVGQLIGTLQYMSPEQAKADPRDLDVRSDVYSLGVILYELLCDRKPYDIGGMPIYEATRIVREQPPTRLSLIDKTLRGDIETVVLKAVDKDRERRYQSADQLGRDIESYLRGGPISARPPSVTYHVRVLARKHKALFGALATVVVVLAAATAFSTRQFFVADAARKESIREADKAKAVNRFLNDMLAAANPKNNPQGRHMSVPEMLDRAAGRIDTELRGKPEIEAAVRKTIGEAYRALGELDRAKQHLAESLAIHRERFGSGSRQVADSLNALGSVAYRTADYDKAESLFREALSILRQQDDDPVSIAQTLGNLGSVLEKKHRRKEAEPILREALRIVEDTNGTDPLVVAQIADQLAAMLWGKRDHEGAEQLFRRSLAIRREQLGDEHPSVAECLNGLGVVLRTQGRLKEAIGFYRRAMEVGRSVYGDEHIFVATVLNNLARALHYHGDLETAEKHYREALVMRRKLLGKHPGVALVAFNLAELMMLKEDYDAAEPLCREGMAIDKKVHGAKHPLFAMRIRDLGRVKHGRRDYTAAVSMYRRALKIFRNSHGDEHREVASTLWLLGEAMQDAGDANAAEAPLREAVDIAKKIFDPKNATIAFYLAALGSALLDAAKPAAAESVLREGLAIAGKPARNPRTTALLRSHLGRFLCEADRYEEAETELLAAYRVFASTRTTEPSEVRQVVKRLIELYQAWSKPEDAARWRAKQR